MVVGAFLGGVVVGCPGEAASYSFGINGIRSIEDSEGAGGLVMGSRNSQLVHAIDEVFGLVVNKRRITSMDETLGTVHR